MPIWVDADSCPKVIKEILFRAAGRTAVPVTLVANQRLNRFSRIFYERNRGIRPLENRS